MSVLPVVKVRYWAAARAAAGVDEDVFTLEEIAAGPVSVAEVIAHVLLTHPGERMAQVMSVSSLVLTEKPLGKSDKAERLVTPGDCLEILPPFAGG